MTDRIHDELLRAAGRQAREEIEAEDRARFDRRWDDYCSGKLGSPEQAALLAESADSLAATLFEPLDDAFKASLVRELRRGKPASTTRGNEGLGGAGRFHRWHRFLADLLGGGQVLTFRIAAAAAVLVAGAVIYPLVRSADGPLPRFELELQGTRAERSAGEAAVQVFQQGGRFNFRLQPRQRVDGAPVVGIFVRREDGGFERWRAAEAAAVTSGEGVVLARNLEWPWGPGRWTLYFAVGRSVPSEDELRRRLDPGAGREPGGWQLLQREISVEE